MNLRLSTRFIVIILLLFSSSTYSAITNKKKVKYRTSFGSCPSRTAGTLTLNLIKVFERTSSLRDVKLKIVKEKLKEKYFISDYKINYDPLRDQLNFKFNNWIKPPFYNLRNTLFNNHKSITLCGRN